MKTCQHEEKIAPGKWEPCGLPATAKTTKYVEEYYCKHHTMLALIAGFQPKPIEQSKEILKEQPNETK